MYLPVFGLRPILVDLLTGDAVMMLMMREIGRMVAERMELS